MPVYQGSLSINGKAVPIYLVFWPPTVYGRDAAKERSNPRRAAVRIAYDGPRQVSLSLLTTGINLLYEYTAPEERVTRAVDPVARRRSCGHERPSLQGVSLPSSYCESVGYSNG